MSIILVGTKTKSSEVANQGTLTGYRTLAIPVEVNRHKTKINQPQLKYKRLATLGSGGMMRPGGPGYTS